MDHIEDWCISRQLWWGHRIPIWYDENNKAYAGYDEENVRKRHHLAHDVKLSQDEDVLDTWFSSALWPFSSLGWPQKTEDLQTFFPTQVLVTGFDIIFFWVARMIMMSLKFTGKVPFHDVYITGLIRDAEGHKMSKSKGNVLDPIDLIDGISLDDLIKKRTFGLMQPAMAKKIEAATRKEFPDGIQNFGTDALRFTYCSLASYTREIRFDINRLLGLRNFCNKLWNASRYVLMNAADITLSEPKTLSLPDLWIRSRLQQTIKDANEALSQYRFDLFAQAVYDFTWNEYCDWYLELSKPILTSKNSDEALRNGTRHTLIHTLEILLRLIHPIMPFMTEAIWQMLKPITHKAGETIMLAPYPLPDASLIHPDAEKTILWLKNIIIAVRTLRSEMNIAPGKLLSVLFRKGNAIDKKNYEIYALLLQSLAKLENIQWIKDEETPPPSASAFVDHLEIFIPIAGFINKEEETARLTKEINKIKDDLIRIENKLNNPQFVDKAPVDVVNKEKNKQDELKITLGKLKKQLKEIS